MKKILPIFVVGILFIGGAVAGITTGEEIIKKNQQPLSNITVLDNEKFEIESKYSYIRSYPNGGGIFITYMTPKKGFSGYVSLKINADNNLNAKLDRETLDKQSQVAEITIQPNEFIELKTYEIVFTATYFKNSLHEAIFNCISNIRESGLFYLISFLFDRFNIESVFERLFNIKKIVLEVEIFDWSSANLPDVIIKRDELIDWVEASHPEFGTFSSENCFAYITYPAHLIVEHWTFLYEKWELRICYHVMIPPYNWSMLWLRPRGEVDPIFAAKKESDGTTYEMPISEYPTFYGY